MTHNEDIKTFLYEIACGIIDIIDENTILRQENKELKHYKEERARMDQEQVQSSVNTFWETVEKFTTK